MDQIKIKRLEVFAKHGVLTEENVLGQKFLISATLYCDTKKAGKSDQLEDSVNYAAVAKLIEEETKQETFCLLERLAWHLAKKSYLLFHRSKRLILRSKSHGLRSCFRLIRFPCASAGDGIQPILALDLILVRKKIIFYKRSVY